MINLSVCCFGIESHVALDSKSGSTIQYPTGMIDHEIFMVLVPTNRSTHYTHYPAFYKVRLHYPTPTLTPACQAGMRFVSFDDGLRYNPTGV